MNVLRTLCVSTLTLIAATALFVTPGLASPPVPTLIVSPTAINFGSVPQGGIASQTLLVANTGIVPVRLGGYGVEGGPFTYDDTSSPNGCGIVPRNSPLVYLGGHGALLLPGHSCTIDVIAQTFSYPPGGIYYYPTGTYTSAFFLLDVDDNVVARVPLTVTIV
jgi:hypothetical protein